MFMKFLAFLPLVGATANVPSGKMKPTVSDNGQKSIAGEKSVSGSNSRSITEHAADTAAVVSADGSVTMGFSRVIAAPNTRTQEHHRGALNSSIRLNSFNFDRHATNPGLDPSSIHLLVPCDERFQQRYHLVTESMKCYAEKFGYTYHFLDRMKAERTGLGLQSSSGNLKQACSTGNFFFDKHCLVARYLQANPQASHVVVFDADVMAVPDQPLDHWINNMADSDLLFYERCTQIEVAAGIYIARNTDAARNFLEGWSQWGPRQPRGFCSADNGAIHIHLLHKLGLETDEPNAECLSKWNALTKGSDDLDEYFTFVQCCRTKLKMGMHPNGPGHPPANHDFKLFRSLSETGLKWGKDNLKVVILPQNTAFVHDHVCGAPASYKNVKTSHPSFYHGVKHEDFVGTWWTVAVDHGVSSVLKQKILTEKVFFKIK